MQTQVTNPVATIQQLMAAHATRADGYEKLENETADTTLKSNFTGKASASRRCNEELLKELAQFGDAAQSEVNRDNDHQRVWKEIAAGMEINPGKSTSLAVKEESALLALYGQALEDANGLPESLRELLEQQKKMLSESGR